MENSFLILFAHCKNTTETAGKSSKKNPLLRITGYK